MPLSAYIRESHSSINCYTEKLGKINPKQAEISEIISKKTKAFKPKVGT